MKLSIFSLVALSGLAYAAVGDLCSSNGAWGICEPISWCNERGGNSNIQNLCPGTGTSVRCCFSPMCDSGRGFCTTTSSRCREFGGQFISGKCPGPDNYKCCVGA
ncbi:hypothetical protein V8F20_008092 [Naviculisporaceae sp. PSN 640]